MIKIVCSSCQKPLSLDESKLPMKEVAFPCPVCKTRLTVDRRTLGTDAVAPGAPPAAPQSESQEMTGDENGFGAKALIVGADHPSLRQAAKLVGFMPVHLPTPDQAREFFMQEYPQVVMISAPQMTPPPLEAFQPIIALTPSDRRKSFFVLVSDNLRTLDGNAAFLYGVNLVVATKDLGAFSQVFRDAYAYHERMYAAMNVALKSVNA
jgi:uncharacterized protein YbaR (Trm112 family)